MKDIARLVRFLQPYWRLALLSLALLTAMVFMDLAIPRLVQRIIDQGIEQGSMRTVLETSAIMLSISALSTMVAIGNNIFSIRACENVARDLREAIFAHIQSFSCSNIDRFTTGGSWCGCRATSAPCSASSVSCALARARS